MSAREELEQTLETITSAEDKLSAIQTKLDPLLKKRDELIWEVLMEEKLLHGLNWFLLDHQTLECVIRDNKPIKELFSYYYIPNLSPFTGIQTSISDDVFTFYFDDPKLMPSLVKKLEMKIDAAEITNRLHQRRREVESLEMLCHTLDIREK